MRKTANWFSKVTQRLWPSKYINIAPAITRRGRIYATKRSLAKGELKTFGTFSPVKPINWGKH